MSRAAIEGVGPTSGAPSAPVSSVRFGASRPCIEIRILSEAWMTLALSGSRRFRQCALMSARWRSTISSACSSRMRFSTAARPAWTSECALPRLHSRMREMSRKVIPATMSLSARASSSRRCSFCGVFARRPPRVPPRFFFGSVSIGRVHARSFRSAQEAIAGARRHRPATLTTRCTLDAGTTASRRGSRVRPVWLVHPWRVEGPQWSTMVDDGRREFATTPSSAGATSPHRACFAPPARSCGEMSVEVRRAPLPWPPRGIPATRSSRTARVRGARASRVGACIHGLCPSSG